jgi:DNA-binding transcriptional MocR family regulator
VGWLRQGIDSAAAWRAAKARKVEVIPLSIYSRVVLPREGLQLGFAAVNGQEIRRGVHQLAIALEGLACPQL